MTNADRQPKPKRGTIAYEDALRQKRADKTARKAAKNADRQRRYRERNGANVGHPPGPQPTRPCGTEAAYRRHLRHGEPTCAECRAANAAAERERRQPRPPETIA